MSPAHKNFPNDLILKDIDGNVWEVMQDFSYHYKDETITVPAGFITDLASVPWPASMMIPKSGRFNEAAVVHDYLYHCQMFTRAKSDAIFREAMKDLGVNWFKRGTMYNAVRVGGWTVWKKRTK